MGGWMDRSLDRQLAFMGFSTDDYRVKEVLLPYY